jgi:hypothetical protein
LENRSWNGPVEVGMDSGQRHDSSCGVTTIKFLELSLFVAKVGDF